MFIVCPHCTTSYAIDLATLGATGRTVRCSRCKEVWLARREDALGAPAPMPAMAEADGDFMAGSTAETDWEALARGDADEDPPLVKSPPLAADWPEDGATDDTDDVADEDAPSEAEGGRRSWRGRLLKRPASFRAAGKSVFNLPATTAAMAALAVALLVWRADVVRLMPQT